MFQRMEIIYRGSIPGRVIQKTKIWYLIPPCLTFSIIGYGPSVSREVQHPSLHLGVVAIKKGAFESPPIMVGQLTFNNTYIYSSLIFKVNTYFRVFLFNLFGGRT